MTGYIPVGNVGYAHQRNRQAAQRRRHANGTSTRIKVAGALLPVAADPSPGWRRRAACAAANPSVFDGETASDVTDAEAICAGCPVRTECLQFALANRIAYGVWGGVHLGVTCEQAAS
jgi:Transcription factor WhiB